MNFKYTALNQDNKQMTGVLEAESIDVAKAELHKMNLAILVINSISEEEYKREKLKEEKDREKTGIKIYRFVAKDASQKETNGTIDAKNPYAAYKRLVSSYHFKVVELYPQNATEAERKTWQKEFEKNAEQWKDQLDEEGIDFEKATRVHEKNKDLQEEGGEEVDQRVVEEIDQFIINTKRVLTTHNHQFSASFLVEIQKVLGELERIRTSNNIRHITEICNQLYELVSHPDQLEDIEHPQQGEYAEILSSMKNSGFVRAQFDLETKAVGLGRIRRSFDRILKKIARGGAVEDQSPNMIQKFLRQVSKKNKRRARRTNESTESRVGFSTVIKNLVSYVTAPSPILRQTRKQEMLRVFREWRHTITKTLVFYRIKATIRRTGKISKWDVGGVFMEAAGFVGWLLFFYLFYFFLADFSLEKGVGLSSGFVIKTLKTDLVVDIVIFLVLIHFLLKIKNEFFRRGFFAPIFLFSFGIASYFLLIINF